MRNNKFLLLALFFTLSVIIPQALNPLWKNHLQTDAVGHFGRIQHFFKYKSFENITYNEYQPGTILFFFLPFLFSSNRLDFNSNLISFWLINSILILIHLVLYKKLNSLQSALIFLGIILFSGPILLFRFELIVSLFMILSIYFWKRKKYFWSFFSLGLAASIKIFPCFLLPYFFLLLLRNKKPRQIIVGSLSFFLAISLIVFLVYKMGMPLSSMKQSLGNHGLKPVGVESVPGIILTILPKIKGENFAPGIGRTGVFGVRDDYIIFEMSFYNWIWIAFLTLFYLLVFLRNKQKKFQAEIPFLIILLFLIFAKNLNPQYMFWFIPFFPLFAPKKRKMKDYYFQLGLIIVIVLLTQYIYPLVYTDLCNSFYIAGRSSETFYMLVLRNVLIVFLFINLFKGFICSSKIIEKS